MYATTQIFCRRKRQVDKTASHEYGLLLALENNAKQRFRYGGQGLVFVVKECGGERGRRLRAMQVSPDTECE